MIIFIVNLFCQSTEIEYIEKKKYKNLKTNDYYDEQAIHEAGLIIEQVTKSYNQGEMDYPDYILNLNRAFVIK